MNCSQLSSLFYILITYLAFRTVRFCWNSLLWIWSLCNGTYTQSRKATLPQNYATSARVFDVWWRMKAAMLVEPTGLQNFCLSHSHFDHPKIALKENVTLLNLTNREAVFVETDEGLDVCSTKTSGFLPIAMLKHAKRIITMPLSSMHTLAESVGDPKGELIFINISTRCGSTLLVQFFEETGKCLSMSEPDVFNFLSYQEFTKPDSKDLDARLTSCVRLLCKPRQSKPHQAYVFKLRPSCVPLVPALSHNFPKCHHIFSYRDPLPVTRSQMRVATIYPLLVLILMSGNIGPTFSKFMFWWSAHAMYEPEWYQPHSFAVKNALWWLSACSWYTKFRRRGINIRGVKYEHLIANPLRVAENILEFVHLPVGWAEIGLGAFSQDSQRNTPMSREYLHSRPTVKISEEDLETMREIALKYGLGETGDGYLLEGTISSM